MAVGLWYNVLDVTILKHRIIINLFTFIFICTTSPTIASKVQFLVYYISIQGGLHYPYSPG